MVEDAPGVPAEAEESFGPTKVSSLTEIMEAAKKSPPKPDPIMLEWFLPSTEDNPKGAYLHMDVETRFSPDPWMFGIRYMSEVQEQKRKQEPDAKGVMVTKHPLADVVALAREVVVSPTWLHNEEALQKFKDNIPPPTFAEFRRKLMLTAGLDGDFFGDYQVLAAPKIYRTSVSGLPKGSDSTQVPSPIAEPKNSSPGPSTTSSAPPSPEDSESQTTSGSSPSTPTIEPRVSRRRPTQTSVTPSSQ